MDTCDVLIVGGGPAGSTCAWQLRRMGLDVVVLDKRTFPRDKTCAGWITPAVVEELELDTADYARSRVFQPISRFRTGVIGGEAVETSYDKTVSYGILRREFDEYLLSRSGARMRLGEKLESFERDGTGWIINGSIRASMLIGAGGHACPVARRLGANGTSTGTNGRELVVAAQEVEFRLSDEQKRDCLISGDTPELYFCPDLMGYAWCFRKGDFLNIGLGREDNSRLADHVTAFCDWMKQNGRIPRDTPDQFHGHAYILYGHTLRPLLDDAALVIGDAAGLAYAQSGEGIRPAIESGLMAAEVIAAAGGDYGVARLEPYRERIVARFGSRKPQDGASSMLPERLRRGVAGYLLNTHWFTRHVVLDRWFLHVHQPVMNATVPV